MRTFYFFHFQVLVANVDGGFGSVIKFDCRKPMYSAW